MNDVVSSNSSNRTIWYNIAIATGLGPAGAQKILRRLEHTGSSPQTILGQDSEWISREFEISSALSESIHRSLESIIDPPEDQYPVQLLVPSDPQYPTQRCLTANPPIPPMLWAVGDLSLLSFKKTSIGVSGSRDASEEVLDLTRELARQASRSGVLVVSGLAQGVDTAAHEGALSARSGTIGVMASGMNKHKGFMPADDSESICLISQFSPNEPWSGPRAMQRNSTIASLSDRVVVMAAGKSGGTWEMGQLCLKRKKPLFVLDIDSNEAEGNRLLIKSGAIPFSMDSPELCWLTELHDESPPSLFD